MQHKQGTTRIERQRATQKKVGCNTGSVQHRLGATRAGRQGPPQTGRVASPKAKTQDAMQPRCSTQEGRMHCAEQAVIYGSTQAVRWGEIRQRGNVLLWIID